MTNEQKKAIIQQQLQQYKVEEYDSQLRHEVLVEVGQADRAKALEDSLVQIKKAVAYLEKKMGELEWLGLLSHSMSTPR